MVSEGEVRLEFWRRRQRPLVLEVRDEIERMILDGEVPAGERLDEQLLAKQMGVSRGPVREAARSLEREGLVRAVAHQGVYVRDLSLEEVLELYDLRASMAGYLCAALAETADKDIIEELEGLVQRMDAAISVRDEELYFRTNLAFHDRIAEASGRRRAAALYAALGKEVRLMRLRVLRGDAALRLSNAEHRRILAAIASGDAEAARAEGAEHHLNGRKRLLESLSGHEDVPTGPENRARRGAGDTNLQQEEQN